MEMNSTLRFDLIAVAFVLGLELEVFVRWTKEHFTAMNVSMSHPQALQQPTHLILIQSL